MFVCWPVCICLDEVKSSELEEPLAASSVDVLGIALQPRLVTAHPLFPPVFRFVAEGRGHLRM